MPLVLEGLRGRKPQTQCWKKYIITLLLRRLLSYYDWDDDDYYYQGVGGHEDLGVGIHGVQGLGASGGLRVFSI